MDAMVHAAHEPPPKDQEHPRGVSHDEGGPRKRPPSDRRRAIEQLRLGAGFLATTGALWNAAIGLILLDNISRWIFGLGFLTFLVGFLFLAPPAVLFLIPAARFARENHRPTIRAAAICYAAALTIVVIEVAGALIFRFDLEGTLGGAVLITIPPLLLVAALTALSFALLELYRARRARSVLVVLICASIAAAALLLILAGAWAIGLADLSFSGIGAGPAWTTALIALAIAGAALPLTLLIGGIAACRHAHNLITTIAGPNQCPNCFYDLTGITTDTCPECGHQMTSGSRRPEAAPGASPPQSPGLQSGRNTRTH